MKTRTKHIWWHLCEHCACDLIIILSKFQILNIRTKVHSACHAWCWDENSVIRSSATFFSVYIFVYIGSIGFGHHRMHVSHKNTHTHAHHRHQTCTNVHADRFVARVAVECSENRQFFLFFYFRASCDKIRRETQIHSLFLSSFFFHFFLLVQKHLNMYSKAWNNSQPTVYWWMNKYMRRWAPMLCVSAICY